MYIPFIGNKINYLLNKKFLKAFSSTLFVTVPSVKILSGPPSTCITSNVSRCFTLMQTLHTFAFAEFACRCGDPVGYYTPTGQCLDIESFEITMATQQLSWLHTLESSIGVICFLDFIIIYLSYHSVFMKIVQFNLVSFLSHITVLLKIYVITKSIFYILRRIQHSKYHICT